MTAGHVVILAFISLIFILSEFWYAVAPLSVAFSLFVYLLESSSHFLQAYIVTMLAAQFIGKVGAPRTLIHVDQTQTRRT